MRKNHRWTTTDLRTMKLMNQAGATTKEIAEVIGVSKEKTSDALKRFGILHRGKPEYKWNLK